MTEKKLIIPTKKFRGESLVVSARLPVELVRRIDEIAQHTGRTRNEIVQTCLEFSVQHLEIEG